MFIFRRVYDLVISSNLFTTITITQEIPKFNQILLFIFIVRNAMNNIYIFLGVGIGVLLNVHSHYYSLLA